MNVGFIGIGTMGQPMAQRLLAAGIPLVVWNRSIARCAPLVARGAMVAGTVDELFECCKVVMVMLLDRTAIDAVLGRGRPEFPRRIRGRTLVMLGTTAAEYSAGLAHEVLGAGGRYIEAPVSGSRVPAEQGALVGMLAGEAKALDEVEWLLRPLCRSIVRCGEVPGALRVKLAVNHYLIVLVVALAETVAAARAGGVDLRTLQEVFDAGPMASVVSRGKLEKLLQGDFSPQARMADVAQIAGLVREQAGAAGVSAPLIAMAAELFEAACARGLAEWDMVAVLQLHPSTHEER